MMWVGIDGCTSSAMVMLEHVDVESVRRDGVSTHVGTWLWCRSW